MSPTSDRPTKTLVVLTVVVALGLWLAGSTAAVANNHRDPYGSTTTTAPENQVRASVHQDGGTVGATVTGTVTNAPIASMIEIHFAGRVVVTVVAQPGTTPFSFQVPQTNPGAKEIRAVGATFDVPAIGPDGDSRYQVRNPNAPDSGNNGNPPSDPGNGNGNPPSDPGNGNGKGRANASVDAEEAGSLRPVTNLAIAVLVAVFAAVVVGGRILSRRIIR